MAFRDRWKGADRWSHAADYVWVLGRDGKKIKLARLKDRIVWGSLNQQFTYSSLIRW